MLSYCWLSVAAGATWLRLHESGIRTQGALKWKPNPSLCADATRSSGVGSRAGLRISSMEELMRWLPSKLRLLYYESCQGMAVRSGHYAGSSRPA